MGLLDVLVFLSLAVVYCTSCTPPDCDKPDCGSCGTACCMLKFKFAVSPDEVFSALVGSLKAGGTDKNYAYISSTDMHTKPVNGLQYTVQGKHSAGQSSVDNINMAVSSNDSSVTFVQMFSISQVYCDQGQNYKNMVALIKGLAQLYAQEMVFGCTNKTQPNF